jgi:hypothetical protein
MYRVILNLAAHIFGGMLAGVIIRSANHSRRLC